MKSIIQNRKRCFICERETDLEEHHCIHGTANRKLSEQDGLKVWLCYEHHRGTNGVHGKNGHELDFYIKSIAQMRYMEYYQKSVDDFIGRYGRNYL